MAVEQFTNAVATALVGAIGNAATSIVVASSTGYPSSGNFRILIDSELLLVTSVAANTWTVTRGIEGTTAASHSNNAAVTPILTAAGLPQAILGVVYGQSFTPPVDAAFSWVNQGGASTATVGNTVQLSIPASASKSNRIRVMAAPATPYTITAFWKGNPDPSDFWNMGLTFRESGSGKMHAFQTVQTTDPYIGSSKFTDPTTFSADYRLVKQSLFPYFGQQFYRIADDGVSRICSFSPDGVNFQTFHSVARTDFLTADQVGFWANSQNSIAFVMTVYHFLQG